MVKRLIAAILAAAGCVYALWYSLTPVEIVAVHNGNTLLVRHFPLLKSRQIAWWEANKGMIQARYGIPHKDENGFYDVYIQGFGDGYRIDHGTDEDSDLLCFDDIADAARCIEKDPLLNVGSARNVSLYYD
ncbi:DUF943 family protein [Kosakonia oryzae]|uniref:DUF943 family protein n=1 Tax=Kosakonia oryzae TaxID=497725 RepID=A0AA94KND2_9ENTR|nr:DUF943 family protein [Kosakonia oryzae]ANI83993.1 DUF943 family protein [Kosakonia oryzae]SFB73591.1 putative membrane protein [Kosakonia oryzae]